MTPTKPSKMKTYGTIAIVILVFLLLYLYLPSSSPAATLIVGSPYGSVGSSELSLLNQIRSLRIDTALFNDAAFRSLVDYSVAITPENVGRPNPFAPLPGESAPAAKTQSSSQTPAR
jgi:hypothetical protein